MKSQLKAYQLRLKGKALLPERIKELAPVSVMKRGYMARFHEEDEDDYVLIEHNCPIAVIAQEYPTCM